MASNTWIESQVPVLLGPEATAEKHPSEAHSSLGPKQDYISSAAQPLQIHRPNSKSKHCSHRPRSTARGKHRTPDSQQPPSFAASRLGRWHRRARVCTRCSTESGSCRRRGYSRRGGTRVSTWRIAPAAAVDRRTRGGPRLGQGRD